MRECTGGGASTICWTNGRWLPCGSACPSSLFWDLTRGWLLADDWLAMQAFDRWPLPLGQDNLATSLRCALVLLAGATTALMIGRRTQWAIFIVWFGACGDQYASRYTIDYHDAIVCQLLLWSLALPIGRRWSLDARADGVSNLWPPWLTNLASTGLVATITWIYLSTVLSKHGAAW